MRQFGGGYRALWDSIRGLWGPFGMLWGNFRGLGCSVGQCWGLWGTFGWLRGSLEGLWGPVGQCWGATGAMGCRGIPHRRGRLRSMFGGGRTVPGADAPRSALPPLGRRGKTHPRNTPWGSTSAPRPSHSSHNFLYPPTGPRRAAPAPAAAAPPATGSSGGRGPAGEAELPIPLGQSRAGERHAGVGPQQRP